MSTDFKPNKSKERAIEAILGAKNWVVITETEKSNVNVESGDVDISATQEFGYEGTMAARGLLEFALNLWEDEIFGESKNE
jgi:hypothetical protein